MSGALLGACGPDASDSGGNGTSGGAATGGATSGGAGGSGGTASGGTGAGAGTGGSGGTELAAKRGQVLLLQDQAPTLFAAFYDETSSGRTCVTVSSDACGARTCDEAPAGQPALTYPHAGTVTFTSPDVTGMATATPGPNGDYTSTENTLADGFTGGEGGLFTATGGDVLAFQQMLSMPFVLLLTEPAYPAGASPVIPRSADLTLQWSRGTPGVIFFVQGSSARPDGLPGSAFFTCSFPSQAGTGVIPSSILQTMAAGTQLLFLTIGSATVNAGEYRVLAGMAHGVYNEARDLRVEPTLE